jgi:hypothetical protein
MNRSDPSLFDARIAAWLEEDPHLAPDQTLPVVLAAFPSIKQRRARAPWRTIEMPSLARFAAAGAALVVVALGAVALFGPLLGSGPGVTPVATPTPAPTPSATPSLAPTPVPTMGPIDTSTWTAVGSPRYGIRVAHPPDWTHQVADHDWTMAEAMDFESTAHERFRSPEGDVGVSAWAIDPGADAPLGSVDEIVAWVEDFCRQTDSSPCTGIAARAVPLCRERYDCHAAILVPFEEDTYAFMPGYADDGRMIIAAVWRPESDPTVAAYGGARRLLLGFLSTMQGGGINGVNVDPNA